MRIIKHLSLVCAALLLLCGCQWMYKPADDIQKEIYYDADKYSDEFKDNLQYQQLDSSQRKYYGQIYTAIRDTLSVESIVCDTNGVQHPGIRIPLQNAHLKQPEISYVFQTFFNDNPQFFYLDRTYSLEGYESNGETLYDALILHFTMDATQRVRANEKLQAKISTLLKGCPNTNDDYLIELYLHDQLLDLCQYDNEAASTSAQQYANAYSAYGALIDGKAVCEGYAKAIQLLLNSASIPSTVIIGHTIEDNEAHMWNLVKINNRFYHLDATWNDDDQHPHYAYLNVSDDLIRRTHSPDTKQPINVQCKSNNDNFFVRNGTFVDTYERDVIAKIVATRAQAGDAVIRLRFDDMKYENGLLFFKNASLAHKKINQHLDDMTMWEYEIRTLSQQNVISLYKKTD